jgi:hypothetical protein
MGIWEKTLEARIGIMDGIEQRNGEKNVDFVARVKREQEAEKKALEEKEYKNLKSICLSCEHAFVQNFIESPHKLDPCTLICKKRAELLRGSISYYRVNESELFECISDQWNRKTLRCSDYCKREE